MRKGVPNEYLEKAKKGIVTQEDAAQLKLWLKNATEEEIAYTLNLLGSHFEELEDEFSKNTYLINAIEEKLDGLSFIGDAREQRSIKRSGHLYRIGAVAATVAVLLVLSIHLQRKVKPVMVAVHKPAYKNIIPGTDKATLTLANGDKIILDSAGAGVLANLDHVRIVKSKSGRLVYETYQAATVANEKLSYNMVNVPRGGQYQIVLPDGTHVWINSASTLRYPTRFEGADRQVQLTGEAYFEVAKDKMHPFRVSVNGMEVQVLGTHFNVMGYKDECATKTTLLEGAVQVIKGDAQQIIKPGQQAIVKEGITVADVDVSEAVEWKNGNFNFSHEKLGVIMRKISRWYDVNIDYKGKITSATFVGTLPRSSNIRDVLKYLELTGLVHFKVIERRVTAMP